MPGSLLEAFVRVAPYLSGLFAQDTAVSVLDREKVLIYVPGRKLDQKVKPGDPFVPSALVCRAITEGRRMVGRVGREVFGVPYVGRAIPIVPVKSGPWRIKRPDTPKRRARSSAA